ncbi:MAG: phosphodiester glycosidase family protein [Myxococcota bacterium]
MIAMLLAGACGTPEPDEPEDRLGPLPSFGGEQIVLDPFPGIRIVSQRQSGDDPQSRWVVLVDPQVDGIGFTVTPDNGKTPLETDRQTGLEFLETSGAVVAVNAHFFSPWPAASDEPADLLGLAVSDGVVVSNFESRFNVAFALAADGRAAVIDGDSKVPFPIDDAVGAMEVILAEGKNVGTWKERHPRTAIGKKANGVVVLAVADGRQPDVANGLTTPELADWLLTFGVTDAINLDGGGSTTLVINDGQPRALNVPVGYLLPGTLRHNGSFIGIRINDRAR